MVVLRWVNDHIEEVFLVLFSVIMVVVISLQVFMRFVLESSLAWSEELARYCFIWLVYIGISYGVKKQRHIKVDVMLLLLRNKGKIILNIFANLIFLGFAIFVITYGYEISERILTLGQTSPALKIPMGYVYMATPVGMGLTAIRIIQQLIKQVKTLLGEEEFDVKTEHERLLSMEDIADDIEKSKQENKD